MIEVIVNGTPLQVPPDSTIAAVIERLGVGGRFAVEVNQAIVPRSTFAQARVKSGDHIEIVQAIGGG
jgi:thiamine biosynthesis protein ThiS